MVISSGTSWPRSMWRRASSPIGDPSRTAARNRSPVATCGMPSRSVSRAACVPLPAPGAPSRTITVIAVLAKPMPSWPPCARTRTHLKVRARTCTPIALGWRHGREAAVPARVIG